MNLQTIKSIDGKDEYVLLPVDAYRVLKKQIDKIVHEDVDYIPFELEEYIQNPIALARIKADLTQEELASRLKVSQAYISKIENTDNTKVSPKLMQKIIKVLKEE